MAEAIFNKLAHQDGISNQIIVTSAGTKDWDIGLRPDHRTRQLLQAHGYPLDPNKRARQITSQEIETSDYIIAMSHRVAGELGYHENVHLLLGFVKDIQSKDIPDPYPSNTFPQAFTLIEKGVKAFYDFLQPQ